MQLKRVFFLLLIVLLPADGTDYLRVTIRGVGVSILDLLLVAILYLELLDGALIGFRVPRFAQAIGVLAVFAACLSAVSLVYVSPYRMGADLKVTLNLLQLAVTVYLAARTFRSRASLRLALQVLLASVSVIGLATVLKSLGLDIPGDARTTARAFGPLTFGVSGLTQIPGPISLVLLAAFPAAVLPAVIRSRLMRAFLGLLLVTAAAVTFSRSLWLALAVQALLVLFLGAFSSQGGRRRWLAGSGLVAALGLLSWTGPRLFELVIGLRPTTVSGRLAGFANALDLATTTPTAFLFGASKDSFRLWTGAATVPHNAILDLLVAKGVLTVMAFLAIQIWIMARLWRSVRDDRGPGAELSKVLLIALAGLLAFGLTSPTMTSLVLWVVLALAATLVSIDRRSDSRSWRAQVLRAQTNLV